MVQRSGTSGEVERRLGSREEKGRGGDGKPE